MTVDVPTFAAAIAIVTLAGAVSGLAGFGFNLLAVPPLLLIYSPQTVVSVTKVLTIATAWVILAGEWRHIDRRTLRGLVPPALVGLCLGVVVLNRVESETIELAVSIIVIAFALFLLGGWRLPGVRSAWATRGTGLVSGVLSTSTGLSGPPVVVLLSAREIPPLDFRVTLVAYFALIDVIGIGLLLATGTADRADLALAALLVPAGIVGRYLGRLAADRTPPARFRRLTLGLLLLTGLTGLVTAGLSLA